MAFTTVRDSVFRFASDIQEWPLDDEDYSHFINLHNICFLAPFPEKQALTNLFCMHSLSPRVATCNEIVALGATDWYQSCFPSLFLRAVISEVNNQATPVI